MAGLVPAIPIVWAPSPADRDRRDKPGDDELAATSFAPLTGMSPKSLRDHIFAVAQSGAASEYRKSLPSCVRRGRPRMKRTRRTFASSGLLLQCFQIFDEVRLLRIIKAKLELRIIVIDH